MPKYTKYLEFSQKERTAIRERDNYRCIFCQIGYEMQPTAVPEMDITDIMHYIPRSSMGLGIRQNGAVGCRYHHHMMDNGSSGTEKRCSAGSEHIWMRFIRILQIQNENTINGVF